MIPKVVLPPCKHASQLLLLNSSSWRIWRICEIWNLPWVPWSAHPVASSAPRVMTMTQNPWGELRWNFLGWVKSLPSSWRGWMSDHLLLDGWFTGWNPWRSESMTCPPMECPRWCSSFRPRIAGLMWPRWSVSWSFGTLRPSITPCRTLPSIQSTTRLMTWRSLGFTGPPKNPSMDGMSGSLLNLKDPLWWPHGCQPVPCWAGWSLCHWKWRSIVWMLRRWGISWLATSASMAPWTHRQIVFKSCLGMTWTRWHGLTLHGFNDMVRMADAATP